MNGTSSYANLLTNLNVVNKEVYPNNPDLVRGLNNPDVQEVCRFSAPVNPDHLSHIAFGLARDWLIVAEAAARSGNAALTKSSLERWTQDFNTVIGTTLGDAPSAPVDDRFTLSALVGDRYNRRIQQKSQFELN